MKLYVRLNASGVSWVVFPYIWWQRCVLAGSSKTSNPVLCCMTTRSGRRYKTTPDMAEGQGVGELVKLLLEERAEERRRHEESLQRMEEQRAREREEERERREREREEERQRRDREMQVLNALLEKTSRREEGGFGERATSERGPTASTDRVKLTKLSENDDVEAFLTTFERMMTAYEVEPSKWAFKLAPQLTGRAQQAYAEDACSYDQVKVAVLLRYDINEETYRQRFRSTTKKDGETYRELATRLGDLARKWTRGCDNVEQLLEVFVTEQVLNSLPPHLRIWARERKPKSGAEAGQLAEDYLQARKLPPGEKRPEPPRETSNTKKIDRHCHGCQQIGHLIKDCPVGKTQSSGATQPFSSGQHKVVGTEQKKEREAGKCYNCKGWGHRAAQCPSNALYCERAPTARRSPAVTREGTVEHHAVTDILLDTGCSKTVVRRSLVPAEKIRKDDIVAIRCAHGDTVYYPLAEVCMEINGLPIQVEAAVSTSLPRSVLVGTDVPKLQQLLDVRPQTPESVMVATRNQRKKQEEEEARDQQADTSSECRPTKLDVRDADAIQMTLDLLVVSSAMTCFPHQIIPDPD